MKKCSQCSHSAICLPLGRYDLFWMLYKRHAKRMNVSLELSTFELMTHGGMEAFQEEMRSVYRVTINHLNCGPPWLDIHVDIRQNADMNYVEMQIMADFKEAE